MRYLVMLTCLLILPAETPADVVTFPGAVAEGYSAVSEVKGDLELPQAKRLCRNGWNIQSKPVQSIAERTIGFRVIV